MEPVNLGELVAWCRGVLRKGEEDLILSSVSTDSRTLEAGACFFALKGERFDGHDFLEEAAAKGARAAVVEMGRAALHLPMAVVAVPDTGRALLDLAKGYRRRFDVPVVGVTGSNGKTTTKEMIASILRRRWGVVASEKNHNNEIGLPLTLLRLERRHGAAVVEMGMRARGEIGLLASVAAPTVGVVTNVGPVHVERLGSVDAVAEAKAELIEALEPGGWAVLNADDPRVAAMAAKARARVITFGLSEGADVRAERVRLDEEGRPRFLLRRGAEAVEVALGMPGRHLVMNALAAATAALVLGTDLETIRAGLEAAEGSPMRMEIVRLGEGVRLLNDAYNASPLSMRAALDTFQGMSARRKVAVLGDMLELGTYSRTAHREVGRHAAAIGVDLLVTVGSEALEIADAAVQEGFDPAKVLRCSTAEEAAQACVERVLPGDFVLVKGSRGIRLERVAEALSLRFGRGGGDRSGEVR